MLKLSSLLAVVAVVLGVSAVACAAPTGGEETEGSGSALSTPAASAETIYGTLSGTDGANETLTLTCGDITAATTSDSYGSYRLTIKAGGRCHLQVGNMPAPGELVFVYSEPTLYDYAVTEVDGVTQIARH